MAVTLSAALNALASTSAPDKVIVLEGSTAKQTDPSNIGGGYLKYVALLSQTGTAAPVATVLENTLGGTVVWSYSDAGVYIATLSGVFTEGKTYCIAGNNTSGFLIFGKSVELPGEDSLLLQTNRADGTPANGSLYQTAIEIRVYH